MAEFPQWLDYDILSNIISYLQPEKPTFVSTDYIPVTSDLVWHHRYYKPRGAEASDVLSMARACRAFSTPCLQSLWRKQTSLLPILKLIPQFKLNSDVRNRRTWILSGVTAPSDWVRFDYYASMVQEIDLAWNPELLKSSRQMPPEYAMEGAHSSVFCYLFYLRNGIFFPNLSILITTPDMRIPLFHSPVLNHVELHCASISADTLSDIWVLNFIDRLHMSPYLNFVALKDTTASLPALRIIFSTPRLQSLEICVAQSFLLTDLDDLIDTSSTQLQFLRVLKIICPEVSRDITPLSSSSTAPAVRRLTASNLESLYFDGPVDNMALLSVKTDCKNLRHFVLNAFHTRRLSLSTQGVLYERIGLRIGELSSGNLETLSILMGKEHIIPFQEMRASHFFPLYKLRNLKKLVFDNIPFIPTDSDLCTMGQSWPLLKILTIPLSRFARKPKATLGGVKSLAELCPHLEQMTLAFDATNPSTIPDSKDQKWSFGHSETALQLLDVGGSTLHSDCIGPATTLLKSLFPNLQTLAFDDYPDYSSDSDSNDGMPVQFGSFELEKALWTKVRENLIN